MKQSSTPVITLPPFKDLLCGEHSSSSSAGQVQARARGLTRYPLMKYKRLYPAARDYNVISGSFRVTFIPLAD